MKFNNSSPDSRNVILEVQDLQVDINQRQVLNIDSLKVFEGDILVIIGPNGSGKTTLLQSMALILNPVRGFIKFRGKIPGSESERLAVRRRFAVVFQESLLLDCSVMDNIVLGLKLRGVPVRDRIKRVDRWLGRFGISELARRNAKTLSGGEAKRVSLARAFSLEPEVLFLDEPFSALDTPAYQSLFDDFRSVVKETGVTTVLVTHDYNEAMSLGTRIVVLMNGSIRQSGPPEEVFSYPIDKEVAEFLRAGNLIPGKVVTRTEGLVKVLIGEREVEAISDLLPGDEVMLYLSYDAVTVSVDRPGSQSSARNRFEGIITQLVPLGQLFKVVIDCGFPLISVITRNSAEELGLRIGSHVVASFKATAVHLIKKSGSGVFSTDKTMKFN